MKKDHEKLTPTSSKKEKAQESRPAIPTLYLNENIPIRLIALLAPLGISALHTVAVGNQGISDEDQLLYAASHSYILLTHNRRHFRQLHDQWLESGRAHSGIIVTRPSEPERLAVRLRRFFEEVYPAIQPPFCVPPPPA